MSDRQFDQVPQQDRAPAAASVDVLRVTCSRGLPDVLVVRLAGEADLATAGQLREAVIDAVEERPGSVLVDLSGLTFCGSAGLNALVEGRRAAAAAGVGFTAVNPLPHVRRVIEMTGLRGFLALRETSIQAL